MFINTKTSIALFLIFFLAVYSTSAQSILPPETAWNGKSVSLIAKFDNPWITPTEKSGFVTTPDYNETINWLKKLSDASPLLSLVPIGQSPEGRTIYMIIASTEKTVTAEALRNSSKPLLLVQAGIHSGEIDGKDAGMMLLRDIAFGDKKQLLDAVNLLYIPILNVDGHERISSYNRPNQRGPQNMGWRTNSQNLNLNRDYAKLDTKEIQSVIKVMNDYDPLLYMDIHVTDGADYQYDITFGGIGKQGYSHEIRNWLDSIYKPQADIDLIAKGHIPGQLLFAVNDKDFSLGNNLVMGGPRFSDAYGDLRHMATILVENHSLKPFKQRVLGTYVLLESTMKLLATKGASLRESTKSDRAKRELNLPVSWKIPQLKKDASFDSKVSAENAYEQSAPPPDSMNLLGIKPIVHKSTVTNSEYIEWTGERVTTRIANYKGTEVTEWVKRPKGYWIPASCYEIIERLQLHGIKMEILKEQREVTVEMYRIQDAKFQNGESKEPYEGHLLVEGSTKSETRKQLFAAGSAYISTDQELGDLAVILLEPRSQDSYFSWGFFLSIFQRTEYIEAYVMEPTIKKMLEESPSLREEFEQKKKEDTKFANDPDAIFSWFYSKTKYYDDRYLLYPVGRQ